MAKKNRVVVAIGEDGFIGAFGPYTKGETEEVEESIFCVFGYGEVAIEISKLEPFNADNYNRDYT